VLVGLADILSRQDEQIEIIGQDSPRGLDDGGIDRGIHAHRQMRPMLLDGSDGSKATALLKSISAKSRVVKSHQSRAVTAWHSSARRVRP